MPIPDDLFVPCQVIVVSLYVAVLVAAVFLFTEFAMKFTDVSSSPTSCAVLPAALPVPSCNCLQGWNLILHCCTLWHRFPAY